MGVNTGLACLLALAGVVACDPAQASDAREILGNWAHSTSLENQAPTPGTSFQGLEFKSGGRVSAYQVFASAFGPGRGEVLESGYGHFQLMGGKLRVRAPSEAEILAWPQSGAPRVFSCQVEFAREGAAMTLSRCPLQGFWVKRIF